MTGAYAFSELEALNKQYAAALRAQLDEALHNAEVKRREAEEAAEYAVRLRAALESVEALQGLQQPIQVNAGPWSLTTKINIPDVTVGQQTENDAPPPAKIAPYVPAIGGQRLKSKLMIFDLFKEKVTEPVTRDQLRQLFFDHYGRKDLQRYWRRPDNALNTAIDRAVADHYIDAIETDGHETLYMIGWKDTETGRPAFENDDDD